MPLRMREEKLKVYDALVTKCSRFKHNDKTMPYTSANGYMFSLLNEDCEIDIQFSQAVQEKYIEEFLKRTYRSYRTVMKGYILMPERVWGDLDALAKYRAKGYDFVLYLESKSL